jgi:hypothetical protein
MQGYAAGARASTEKWRFAMLKIQQSGYQRAGGFLLMVMIRFSTEM